MIGRAGLGADFQEAGGLDRARVEDQAGDGHAVHVGDRDGRPAVRRDERGDAEAQDDGVGLRDLQGVVERVMAGGEQDVLAGREGGVDPGGVGRRGLGDVKLVDGDRRARRGAVGPTDALGVGLKRRDEDGVLAGAVDGKVRLLADDGRPLHHGIGRVGEVAGRGVRAAHEDHVPDPVGPLRPLAVAREPLLLRGGDDLAVHDRVGQEAAAGPARVPLRVEVEQVQLPLDVQPPQRGGLRDGDPRDALGGRRGDGEVLQGPPEVARRVGVGHPPGVDVHPAVDVDVVGVPPQPGHLRVEADLEIDACTPPA